MSRKSLKLKVLLSGLMMAMCTTGAQADSPAAAPAAAAHKPLLWKVSDADNSVYLLGSFHLLKPNDYPLSKDVDAAFDDAEALVFEIDPAEMASPDLAAKLQKFAAIDDGKTLSQVLSKPTLDKLEQMLKVGGGSLAQVESSEPWAITMGMMIGMAQASGFRQEQGIDAHFMARAKEAGKPVSGLETVEAQFAALDAVPHAEQAYSLGELLNDPQKALAELNDLHNAWKAGDLKTLDGEMRVEMAKETPQSYRLLNVARNDAWVPKVAQKLDGSRSDDTLVVVGALHLLGKDGVVEKLREKGYKVERICSACQP